MPKLLPRQPQIDAAKIRRRQNILKNKIMPLRRRTLPHNHVPKNQKIT
jgi:recombination DNA repair RAD52 pathway protein